MVSQPCNCWILRDQTSRRLVDMAHKNNSNNMKLTRTLDLLARPRGFEPPTLGLECVGLRLRIVLSCIVSLFYDNYFARCLRKRLKDSLT